MMRKAIFMLLLLAGCAPKPVNDGWTPPTKPPPLVFDVGNSATVVTVFYTAVFSVGGSSAWVKPSGKVTCSGPRISRKIAMKAPYGGVYIALCLRRHR